MTQSSCSARGCLCTEQLWLRLVWEVHPSPHNHPAGDVPPFSGKCHHGSPIDPLSAENCIKPTKVGTEPMGRTPGCVLAWKWSLGEIYHLCIGKKKIVGKETRGGCKLEMFWSGFSTPICPIFHGWDVSLLWVRFTPGLKLPFGSLSTSLLFLFASVTIDFGLNNIFKKASRGVINQEGALL